MEIKFNKNKIKVLIAPMMVMEDGEIQSEYKRIVLLVRELIKAGHEVALSISEQSEYRNIDSVMRYPAPISSPLGLPKYLAGILLDFGSIRFIEEKKKVNNYEEFLYVRGALDKKYFNDDIEAVRDAIRQFDPDVVYTETRLSAIIASKLEDVKVVTAYSFSNQNDFRCGEKSYSDGVLEVLKDNHIYNIKSIYDIFNAADLKIIESSYEIEPVNAENVEFIGPMIQINEVFKNSPKINFNKREVKKNKIVVSMNNCSISIRKVIKELELSIQNSGYVVYICTNQIPPYTTGNILVSKKFDLNKLLPEALLFINNGEDENVMRGLNFGVPQIICPGNMLKRKYNAYSISELKAGIYIKNENFTAKDIRESMDLINNSIFYSHNAKRIGKDLVSYGGVKRLIEILEGIANEKEIRKW